MFARRGFIIYGFNVIFRASAVVSEIYAENIGEVLSNFIEFQLSRDTRVNVRPGVMDIIGL